VINRVSSKDIAKYAGVSQTTVSRVLNTPNLVKENTYKKLMVAIVNYANKHGFKINVHFV